MNKKLVNTDEKTKLADGGKFTTNGIMTNSKAIYSDNATLANTAKRWKPSDNPRHTKTTIKITRQTVPYLRPHRVKGRVYYCWHDGRRPEVYLGTADYIKDCVLAAKRGKE